MVAAGALAAGRRSGSAWELPGEGRGDRRRTGRHHRRDRARRDGRRRHAARGQARLGGATCSFSRGGLTVDTGQHVFLRCCTAYRGLLDRLGMTGHATLQDRFDVTVLAPGGGRPRLRRTALPGPLHLLPALGRLSASISRRAGLGGSRRARPCARRPGRPGAGHAAASATGSPRTGRSERTRRALWDLFSVSALNIAGDDASLALAAMVVKTGLLGEHGRRRHRRPDAAAGRAARRRGRARLLAKLGGQVAAEHQGRRDRAGAGRRLPASRWRADGAPRCDRPTRVVLAVPARAGRAADPGGRAARADRRGLGRAGRVAHRQRARDLRPAGHWTCRSRPPSTRRCSGSSTGPGMSGDWPVRGSSTWPSRCRPPTSYVDAPVGRAAGAVPARAGRTLPGRARRAGHRLLRHPRAAGHVPPGARAAARCGPKAATALPGLVLAGAWTDTGWPDTMEGAVRSGLAAAAELRQTC